MQPISDLGLVWFGRVGWGDAILLNNAAQKPVGYIETWQTMRQLNWCASQGQNINTSVIQVNFLG